MISAPMTCLTAKSRTYNTQSNKKVPFSCCRFSRALFHEFFRLRIVEGFGGRGGGGGGGGGNRYWNNDDSRSYYRDGNRDGYARKDNDSGNLIVKLS